MKISHLLCFALAALVCIALLGQLQPEESAASKLPEQVAYEYYCEQVAEWHSHPTIPEEVRPGWPPFQGECTE